ncbi:uncharacterized protein [Halyomorpha halys]|uniref:uncharacterized protein n=1 Tax=Halyomorpha halys TaxID=286706 RepID=UPI0006D4E8FE|nr:uncharacterized protein LOC106684532 [Halyomorpha halys]
MYLLYIAVLSWCVAAYPAANVPKGFGKRLMIFKRLDHCKDQGLGTWTFSVSLVKTGSKYLFNGNITWPLDIDENLKVRITASLFKDGQFHDGYLDAIMDGCQQFEQLSNGFLKSFFASTDIENNQCPYPKGTYIYKNFQMESNPTLPNSTPNGLYNLNIYIIDGKDNLLGCGTSYVDVKADNRKAKQ